MTEKDLKIDVVETKDYRVFYANTFIINASEAEVVMRISRLEPKLELEGSPSTFVQNIECQVIMNKKTLEQLYTVIGKTLNQLETAQS